MKILFLDSPAFAKKDMLEAFHNCEIETDLFMHEDYNVRKSAAYDAAFDAAVEGTSYDFVFSFNYYPILATCAHRHNLRYVSYVYDSPLVALYCCITSLDNLIRIIPSTIQCTGIRIYISKK